MLSTDKLHEQVCYLLADAELPSENTLRKIVINVAEALRQIGHYVSDDQVSEVIVKVQTQFVHRMEMGFMFEAEDPMPWLEQRQGDIKWFYWERYKKNLLVSKNLSNHVVNTIDMITDKILDHIENPMKSGIWSRKGLVVGDVQSGKTANYTGLICKAADAGYNVIIVLAGMLNTLRNQTQSRLDNDFMGWCTIKHENIGSSSFNSEKKHPICFTTAASDFDKNKAIQIAMGLGSIKDPIFFVVKKNKSTLKNLYDWLSVNNGLNIQSFSMLLIDDEADHASINTNKDDNSPTTINKAIRDLLSLFNRSAFVGYTATPFANIFIDPDSEDEMLNGESYKDLYPKDFIFCLDPPTNYVGPKQFFSDSSQKNLIALIDDNEDVLPIKHKIGFEPLILPESLKQAIRSFIVARGIRLIRKHENCCHSMMINVSRFVYVQERIKGLVLEYVKEIRNAVNNFSCLPDNQSLKNSIIKDLYTTWQKEYYYSCEWEYVKSRLKVSIDPVTVLSVNSKSDDVLDYQRERYPSGRSVIVVGGLALSRGLTLEGLIVSYFLRNSIMYDTLMQMGRWFGYRDGYDDLCRIYLTDAAASWYSYIADSTEELRREIFEMSEAKLTPLEFGLKVRSHPEALIVTARNKMRASRSIPVKISLGGRLAETSVIYSSDAVIKNNMRVLEKAITEADMEQDCQKIDLGYYWKGISIDKIIKALEGFQNHPMSLRSYTSPLVSYLNSCETRYCDVLLRSVNGEQERMSFAGFDIGLPKRTASIFDAKYIEFNKRRVASRGDEKAGIPDSHISELKRAYQDRAIPDKEYRKYRMIHSLPPLFMIQVVQVRNRDGDRNAIVGTFGLSFPGDPGNVRTIEPSVEYVVNTVWWKNNFYNDIEEEDYL